MFQTAPTLSVITLPVLAPIAALLQLLFPGLLRDQWKQYRVAITVLLTQSTVFMIHWALITFWVTDRVWWLSDAALTFAIVVVAALGLIASLIFSMQRVTMVNRRLVAYHTGQKRAAAAPSESAATGGIYIPPVPAINPLAANPADRPPAQVEYIALSIFAALGILWALYQLANAVSPLDQVASVTAACILGLLHLFYRRTRSSSSARKPIFATTEVIFLAALVLTGTGLGVYFNQTQANLSVDRVVTDWPTYRGNKHRTGVIDGSKAPQKPELLWSFDPKEPKGSVMFHSTPTVVDGLVYIGALHQLSTISEGFLYCINARDDFKATDAGKPAAGQLGATIPIGTQVWKFTGLSDGSAKPIFCAPTVHAGIIYFGEGYHEDTGCRLFALYSGTGKSQWMLRTTSHTESPPTIVANRIYFGAGDDGVMCYDMKNFAPVEGAPTSPPSPKLIWQAKNLHIDSAPCVADGRVFVGSVIGDIHATLAVLALDADTGEQIWKLDTPLPVPGCASHSSGRVYFGLGNGKLGADAENPAGAVWCIDAATGNRLWEYKTAAGVFSTPVIANGRCYFTSQDKHIYCLDEVTGKREWDVRVEAPIVAAPIVTEEDVVVITVAGTVHCVDAKSSQMKWTFVHAGTIATDQDVYASPTLSGGRIYFASNGKVHCIADKPVTPTKSP